MSETDRELLELAAKAAGIDGYMYSNNFRCMAHWNESDGGWFDACCFWDPLTDDGDALRLAVALGMNIDVGSHPVGFTATAVIADHNSVFIDEYHDDDAMKATRRAITRAAAEIGKAMNGE